MLGRRPPVCLTYPFAVMSGERLSSRESHATSTLASGSSDGFFVQGPAEETSAWSARAGRFTRSTFRAMGTSLARTLLDQMNSRPKAV